MSILINKKHKYLLGSKTKAIRKIKPTFLATSPGKMRDNRPSLIWGGKKKK